MFSDSSLSSEKKNSMNVLQIQEKNSSLKGKLTQKYGGCLYTEIGLDSRFGI